MLTLLNACWGQHGLRKPTATQGWRRELGIRLSQIGRKVAAVMSLLIIGMTYSTSIYAAPPTASADALIACPYSSADIDRAIGLRMNWKSPGRDLRDGMHHRFCNGTGDGNNAYLFITQIWVEPKNASKRLDAYIRLELKGAELIANDPDGARWLARPDSKSYKLAYIRENVLTLLSVSSPPNEKIAGLREGLAKLKRLP